VTAWLPDSEKEGSPRGFKEGKGSEEALDWVCDRIAK